MALVLIPQKNADFFGSIDDNKVNKMENKLSVSIDGNKVDWTERKQVQIVVSTDGNKVD